jgi:murein L,D-transpeptidase YcbB/YkuD
MTTGEKMLALAEQHIKEKYVNVLVPKNDPNWKGPWDCAEFMSWLVYQTGGFLYGCTNNKGNPATTEAYTGAWQRDSKKLGKRIPWQQAASIKGAVLLRYPPAPNTMGHIAVSDGKGGTVEAMGKKFGVCRGKASGRDWDTGVLVPGFTYRAAAAGLKLVGPALLYGLGRPGMEPEVVERIQTALLANGISPGRIDGDYGHNTTAGVAAFQSVKGLVVDGKVGRQTAKALKISLELH